MTAKEKRQPMPKWLWQLSPKILNFQQKRLLSFVWWNGDKGCREWNYRLMKRFRVSRSTIKRWIKHLNDIHLIYINYPHTKHRTLYRRPYFSIEIWYKQQGGVKSSQEGPKVSHINNAKHSNNHKTGYYYAVRESETPAGTADADSLPSNAGGLSCSGEEGPESEQLEKEAKEIKARANRDRQRKKDERFDHESSTL